MILYHGGKAGLKPGDRLVPSPPHVEDGCPVCLARAAGKALTVGAYRLYARSLGPRGIPILRALEGAHPSEPVDPPSARDAVYLTSDVLYATWYAARSRGDLYRVRPMGTLSPSPEDSFPSWTAPEAVVVEVLRRGVRLDRRERRELNRQWGKADRARAAA